MNSQDLQQIEVHLPELIAESVLSFPGMRVMHTAEPFWNMWRARLERGSDFMEVGMTLFDDATRSWGGSPITADCSHEVVVALWAHLQSRHCGVWLHDPDCIIHTQDSFNQRAQT